MKINKWGQLLYKNPNNNISKKQLAKKYIYK